MLVVTTDSIPGKEIIEVKGLVKGSTVRSKHIGKDMGASLKTIVGGDSMDIMRCSLKLDKLP